MSTSVALVIWPCGDIMARVKVLNLHLFKITIEIPPSRYTTTKRHYNPEVSQLKELSEIFDE